MSPAMIEAAKRKYPAADFLCRDILREGIDLEEHFDYTVASGTFNMYDSTTMYSLLLILWTHTKRALSFNLLSSYVDYREPHPPDLPQKPERVASAFCKKWAPLSKRCPGTITEIEQLSYSLRVHDYDEEKRLTTISIMQPAYLPWPGYFNLIARADKFVYLDNVQFAKSWQNRNRILVNGQPHTLTAPVMAAGVGISTPSRTCSYRRVRSGGKSIWQRSTKPMPAIPLEASRWSR